MLPSRCFAPARAAPAVGGMEQGEALDMVQGEAMEQDEVLGTVRGEFPGVMVQGGAPGVRGEPGARVEPLGPSIQALAARSGGPAAWPGLASAGPGGAARKQDAAAGA